MKHDNQVVLLKAVANDCRLNIVKELYDGEKGVGTLVKLTGVGQSPVSQHLKILRDAGIVVAERYGTKMLYSINRDCEGLQVIDKIVEEGI